MVYIQKTIQTSFKSFTGGLGVELSPENKWVQLADIIPWAKMTEVYQLMFPSDKGRVALPFRMFYAAELIKRETHLSDRKLVEAIRDTPAFQYFMGVDQYKAKAPFTYSSLTRFRTRIVPISELLRQVVNDDVRERIQLVVANEVNEEATLDRKAMIIDATAVPVNIEFPQDAKLLNKSRLNLEDMIDDMSHALNRQAPRTYKRVARAEWTAYSRKPGRRADSRRKQVKAQLQYVRRDLRYVDELLADGGQLTAWQEHRLAVIRQVFEQQDTMYRNKTHRIENRIVSLNQPMIRPIV